MVPIDPVMLKYAINQPHQPHPTSLEVIQRTVQMHNTILDLLSHRIHGIDVQRQIVQLIVHLLQSEDAVLRGQFFKGGIGDGLDHSDLLIGRLHRISIYLKISSSGQSLQFYQMNRSPIPVDEKTKCLALQRVKARIIKDTFINEGSIDRGEFVTQQVVKYETLLSEKMLNKIKTEQLKEFEKDVQEYCKESQKMCELQRQKRSNLKQINMSQILCDYKNSTKVRLLQINKKRTRTSQSFQLAIEPGRLPSPEPENQYKVQSPLGNKKIREAIQQNKKRITPLSRFRVNGKGVNSQIIQLLEKLDEIQSIQKLRKRRETINDQEEEYLQGRSDHLKKEKDRLSTAFQNQQRSKFKPMGRIKKDQKNNYERNDFKIQELDYLKKLHNRAGKALMLQPLKKSAIIVSSNYIGKASIHLEQGLPKSIKNQIPHKIKRSQGTINDNQKPQDISGQNVTPPLLRSNNLFITNNSA